MSSPTRSILVIGGGFSGMSAAIQLRKHGAKVDLVEIDAGWRNYGAGISLNGATLRAFKTLGILETYLERGSATDGVEIRLPHGQVVATLPTPRLAGPDVPGGGGIMRPVLGQILAEATRAAGVDVRLGCTFTAIDRKGDGLDVRFTDNEIRHYDLVVGADGLYSAVRRAMFPGGPTPEYVGQSIWRAVLRKSPDIKTVTMWLGATVKPGVNPVSKNEMYLFITEPRPENDRLDPSEFVDRVRGLLAGFPDPVLQGIRAQVGSTSEIVFRPIERLLVPQPWFADRVVLIGDTVHATTPHLAAGACIGVEDALVLAEELSRTAVIEEGLKAWQARRWERCRMVVENSARLGEIEITGGDKAEHAQIMRDSLIALAQPI